MQIQQTEYADINAAVILYCNVRLPAERKQQIETRYGAGIFVKAETIYNQAIGCGLGPDGDMDSGLDGMHAFLKANYPWLTREARTDLNYQFMMNWK